jgi:hypothetical protein
MNDSRPGPRRQPRFEPGHGERATQKPGAQVCVTCGLVQRTGRWTRGEAPAEAERVSCPACERARERRPAAVLALPAEFLDAGVELDALIRNAEQAECAEHPLERLIEVERSEDGCTVTTTGVHVARRIANALERRFHRQARFRWKAGDPSLEVDWPSSQSE